MGNHEVALTDPLFAKKQDVNVDDARTPAARRFASAIVFDLLGGLQQLTRRARPLHFDHLVQESRLVGDAPRFGFYDAALTQDARSLLTQAPAGSAEVAGSPTEV